MKKAVIIIVVGLIALFLILSGASSHYDEWLKRNIEARRLVNIELSKRYDECNEKFPIHDKITPPEHTQCIKDVEKDTPTIQAKYNYEPPEKSANCESETFLLTLAEKKVLRNLKAPATAKFSNEKIWYVGNCTHQITGDVDSHNSYGAMIRTPFALSVKYVGEQYENDDGYRVKDETPELEKSARELLRILENAKTSKETE